MNNNTPDKQSKYNMNDLLVEIGTEELPPKQINKLTRAFANNLAENLKELSIPYGEIKIFSTPRRLAVLIEGVADKQPSQQLELKGPPVNIAFDKEGKPTIAALKFAENCGVTVAKLKRIEEKKGTFLFHRATKPGQKTLALLPEAIATSLKKLPIKRAMKWGNNKESFVRPVHWLLALFGNKTIKLELCGVKAGNKTFGHRFHHPKSVTVTDSNQYESLLEKTGFVIADPRKRQQKILDQIASLTKDETAVISDDLLSEVTNIVEWPVALVGRFHEKFLKIPHEGLITTLENHQRCFPIADETGELLPRFIMVSNIDSKNPEQVIAGNEKVIQARFDDAEYFYQKDLKSKFADNLGQLKSVSFYDGLGSLYDKTMRLKVMLPFIAAKIGGDVDDAKKAAELSKCDLVTSMVWEFPELQGIMGYYYANKTENKEVATAIKEQYLPKLVTDPTPSTKTGTALALADRIDNLVGLFILNKIPTGDKDPFGLRRAASGIVKIILEKNLDFDLKELIEKSYITYQDSPKNREAIVAKILDFIYDRLRSLYVEQNKNINVFRAVLAVTPTNLLDFKKRFEAVDEFTNSNDSQDLVEIYKRIRNILDKTKLPDKTKFKSSLIQEEAERNLVAATEETKKLIEPLYQQQNYAKLLLELVKLKKPLAEFFEQVMVMAKEEKIRNNRLLLLKSLQELFILIADLSFLVSGEKTGSQ